MAASDPTNTSTDAPESHIPPPNYTQTPNAIYDLLPLMKESEMRVTLCLCRETFGWRRNRVKISIGTLSRMTGMERTSVLRGIEAGIERGTIKRQVDRQDRRGGHYYWLNVAEGKEHLKPTDADVETDAIHEVHEAIPEANQSTKDTGSFSEPVALSYQSDASTGSLNEPVALSYCIQRKNKDSFNKENVKESNSSGGGERNLRARTHEANGFHPPPPPQNQSPQPLDLENPFVAEIKEAWHLDLDFLDRRDLEAIPVAAAYLGKHGAQSGDVRRYLERWAKVYPNRTLPLISQLPRTFAFVMNHPVNENPNENGSDNENDRISTVTRRILERQNQTST